MTLIHGFEKSPWPYGVGLFQPVFEPVIDSDDYYEFPEPVDAKGYNRSPVTRGDEVCLVFPPEYREWYPVQRYPIYEAGKLLFVAFNEPGEPSGLLQVLGRKLAQDVIDRVNSYEVVDALRAYSLWQFLKCPPPNPEEYFTRHSAWQFNLSAMSLKLFTQQEFNDLEQRCNPQRLRYMEMEAGDLVRRFYEKLGLPVPKKKKVDDDNSVSNTLPDGWDD